MRRLAYAVAASTVVLILAGSLVTSTGSGLAVPDWPLSYGQLFPPMVGGILYEHGHRMIAGTVALLVLAMTVVTLRVERRPWLRALVVAAAVGILLQAALGGITVLTFLPTAVSMTHAIVAQTFFLIAIAIAYAVSPEADGRATSSRSDQRDGTWQVFGWVAAIIYLQLFLGAYMRHSDAGLAVLDYPLIGGQVLPVFDQGLLGRLNRARFEADLGPVSLAQVTAHAAHRLGALAVAAAAGLATLVCLRRGDHLSPERKPAWRFLLLADAGVLAQVVLGALTVLTRKVPIVASLHVLVGALTLAAVFIAVLRAYPFERAAAHAAANG